jgi:hypothetical protein
VHAAARSERTRFQARVNVVCASLSACRSGKHYAPPSIRLGPISHASSAACRSRPKPVTPTKKLEIGKSWILEHEALWIRSRGAEFVERTLHRMLTAKNLNPASPCPVDLLRNV